MNILLTGASGFLGGHLYRELSRENRITTLGRTPVSDRHIYCDLTDGQPLLLNDGIDTVVHAAGKAHSVPRTALERREYEQVNVEGTVHLLAALEQLPRLPKSIVHISTVLVYGRSEGQLLTETTPLEASDAYGLSKRKAEQFVRDWGERTDVRTTILRLPLVVSEQPNGNLATMQHAIRRGYYVRIGTGLAQRSMVRADDVAAVIIRASDMGGTFNLTDGQHPTVCALEEALARRVNRERTIPAVPMAIANAIAHVGDGINRMVGRRFPLDSITLRKLTHSLTFSDDLARQQLDWSPRPVLDLFP